MPEMAGSISSQRHVASVCYLLLVLGFSECHAQGAPFWETCLSRYYSRPRCDDTPLGYECVCGPGFKWNTNLCMSTAVDSRLEYEKRDPVRYTLLLDVPFPELHAFTVTLWLKVPQAANHSTIFSYRHEEKKNFMRLFLKGSSIRMTMGRTTINTKVVVKNNTWMHFALSWGGGKNGRWTSYINGSSVATGNGLLSYLLCNDTMPCVPSGGEFVLGQSSRTKLGSSFDQSVSFVGSLAHVHLWQYVRGDRDIDEVYADCSFSHCGNVTWVEFRAGTRGAMRLRWPSGIQSKTCHSEEQAELTCDKYCSQEYGVQCKEQTKENMVWSRTPANTSISVPCPGQENKVNAATAHRSCHKKQYSGVWAKPEFDDCISSSLRKIKIQMEDELKPGKFETTNTGLPMTFLEKIHEMTSHRNFTNPMDLSTVIDCLGMIIDAQDSLVSDPRISSLISHGKQNLKNFNYNQLSPTNEDVNKFSKLYFEALDMLIDKGQEVGWNRTKPPGEEGDEFIKVMEKGSRVTYKSLLFHVKDTRQLAGNQAEFRKHLNNSVVKVRLVKVKDFVDRGDAFPSKKDARTVNMTDIYGYAILPKNALNEQIGRHNITDEDYIGISTVRYSGFTLKLPNHNVDTASQEDNVNSVLFGVYVHIDGHPVTDLLEPVAVLFNFTSTFNISNPECVKLQHGNRTHLWKWESVKDSLNETSPVHARCEFFSPGLYAVTTDMYDVNWDKGEKPHDLMTIPSYIGCAISALLCLITLVMLLYLRTSSTTAAIHKHFSLALLCCHLSFMFGINQIQHQLVCHVFSVMFHYFFLAQFMWLMNEAFNLYIVITYTAHSHGQDTGSTSMYRFYILGWVLPAVLVGAFVGSHTDDYYANDMCWIAWEYIWLFLGPPMGIVCVAMLVLTFTAKEQNESSYAKDESANKLLQNHTRALWTQLILLSVVWAFAFLSLKMRGSIIKYLFALFNLLQGSFFLVFYFLLNEEVRNIYKQRRIRKNLAMQGYELTSSAEGLNQSQDSLSGDNSEDGQEEDEHTHGACGNEPLVPRRGKQGRKEKKLDLRVHSLENLSDDDGVRQTAV